MLKVLASDPVVAGGKISTRIIVSKSGSTRQPAYKWSTCSFSGWESYNDAQAILHEMAVPQFTPISHLMGLVKPFNSLIRAFDRLIDTYVLPMVLLLGWRVLASRTNATTFLLSITS